MLNPGLHTVHNYLHFSHLQPELMKKIVIEKENYIRTKAKKDSFIILNFSFLLFLN